MYLSELSLFVYIDRMLILRYRGDRLQESFQSYCERMELRALLEQWDTARNLPLTPEQISYGSKRKVWWRCKKGHIWQAAVHTRTGNGTGCPVCAGKVARAGENDLTALFPELAHQWHPTRNGRLTPTQVLPGSHRMAWWGCEKGHEWRAQVKSRVAGCGCPVCANRQIHAAENDLASQYPQLAAQWHPTRNRPLTAPQVTPSSNRKVWWRCEKGHDYQAAVGTRTMSGSGCRYCAGRKVLAGFNDLETLAPNVARQWHPTLNGNLTPQMVTTGSRRKVWWECRLGHVWQAAIYSRTGAQKCGCPVCAGRISKKRLARYQALLAEAKEVIQV